MFGNITVWRGNSGNASGCDYGGLLYGLAAFFAERGFPAIGFPALRASRLKTRPAVVAKDRVKRILGLAFRANHNGESIPVGLHRTQFHSGDCWCISNGISRDVYSTELCQKQVKGFV
jgi:hypothetical protein